MNQAIVTHFIDCLAGAFREGDAAATDKVLEANNVRRLEELYRAIARGDFADAVATMTDDVEMQIYGPADFDFIRRARGPAQVLAAMQANFGQMEDQKPELRSLVAQGNAVVVIARERSRYRPTGKPYDLHWVQHFEFIDGKVARFQEFGDAWRPVGDG